MSIAKKIKAAFQSRKNILCDENDIKALMFLKTKEKALVIHQYIQVCPDCMHPDPVNLWLPITGTINFFHMRNKKYFPQVLECLEVFYRNDFKFSHSFIALNKKEYSNYLSFTLTKSSHDFFVLGAKEIVKHMYEEDKKKTIQILKELIDKNKAKKTVHFKNGNIKLLEDFYQYYLLLEDHGSNLQSKKVHIL